jgi:hypothetical protein
MPGLGRRRRGRVVKDGRDTRLIGRVWDRRSAF